ncbi:MAG: hypothetical protein WCX71_01750 [Candidatus Buchananbacteria bacterium]
MKMLAEAVPIGKVADIDFVRDTLVLLGNFEEAVNLARLDRGEKATAIVASAELAPGVVGIFWLHLCEYGLLYDRQRWGTGIVGESIGVVSSDPSSRFGYINIHEEDAAPNFDRYLNPDQPHQYCCKKSIQPLQSNLSWHSAAIPITDMPIAKLMRLDIPENIKVLTLSVGVHDQSGQRAVIIQSSSGWQIPSPQTEAEEHYQAAYGEEYAQDYLYGASLLADGVTVFFSTSVQGLNQVKEQELVNQFVDELDRHWFEEVARVFRPDIEGQAILLEYHRLAP